MKNGTIPSIDRQLSEFVLLLHTAQQASDAVDNFDLHSTDADSVTGFADLWQKQNEAFNALIAYVQAHGDTIKQQLTNPMVSR